MYRDPSCGCCEAWAAHVRQGDRHDITTVDHPDMASVKTQNDVPDDLRSCHTMIADEYVIEGHVPRSEEHTSELQSLMRISYAVFCLKKTIFIHFSFFFFFTFFSFFFFFFFS